MDIAVWLDSLDSNPPTKRKRPVDTAQFPPSPPMSDVTPRRPKRQRKQREDDNVDARQSADFDATPRAHLPSSYASSTSRSSQSGTSSPRKAMAALGVGNEAGDYKLQSFPLSRQGRDAHRLPAPLLELLEEIEGIQDLGKVAFLDEDLRTGIEQLTGSLPDSFYAPSADRAVIGPCPSPDDVQGVVDDAQKCFQYKNTEAGWNGKVHFPLLRLVLFGQYTRTTQLMDVEICTTADIIHEYNRVRSGTKKKVDFVIAFDPTAHNNEQAAQERIEELQHDLPEFSINHTDYEPLRFFPIAISIETKRPDGSEMEGSLQMGVWHAAQWNMLQSMAQDEDRPLKFLLAIIVIGHNWSLAATTREGNKTVGQPEQFKLRIRAK
ncbi:hypothetical protein DHEL01_v211806 [Diaporthe helianthi]|uniref:PD-(D/E)XK nuclease-like domain-containing protein n=1 Tax=Diaporthe helianthi TaxID=158607 RepID=A0A2P5HHS9_DIAHE|nr:hypothetical protein DHEL01_v211806 [Diaporthe helianthi]